MPSRDESSAVKLLFASAMPLVYLFTAASAMASPLAPNVSAITDWALARLGFFLAILASTVEKTIARVQGQNEGSFLYSPTPIGSGMAPPKYGLLRPSCKPAAMLHDGLSARSKAVQNEATSELAAREEEVLQRMLTRVICGALELPSSSPKLAFMRSLADEMLADSERVKDPAFQDSSQAVLADCFLLNADRLAQLLARSQSQPLSLQQMFQQVSKGPVAALSLAASTGLWLARSGSRAASSSVETQSPSAVVEQAEKVASDLLWLCDKLELHGGLRRIAEPWAQASQLSLAAAYMAVPRVQTSVVVVTVKILSLVACDDTACGRREKVALLINWLPLLCMAYHAGDGPMLGTIQKQVTEDDIHRILRDLPLADQEAVFSAWLRCFCQTPSDWPNPRGAYSAWCARVRAAAAVA